MGQVRREKRETAWDRSDGDDDVGLFPYRPEGTVAAQDNDPGGAIETPVISTASVDSIHVKYGTVSESSVTQLGMVGDLAIVDGRVVVTCTRAGLSRGDRFVAGLVGGAIGVWIAWANIDGGPEERAKKVPQVVIDVAESEGFYDAKRRVFSLRLHDGDWLSVKVVGPSGREHPRLLELLESAYGERLRPATLGRMTLANRVRVLIVLVLLAVVAIVLVFLAINDNARKGRSRSPYDYPSLPHRSAGPFAITASSTGGGRAT